MPGTDLQPGDMARSKCALKANDQTTSSVDSQLLSFAQGTLCTNNKSSHFMVFCGGKKVDMWQAVNIQ